jgi:hypothetical protein
LNAESESEKTNAESGHPDNLANEILDMITQNCKNPGEAFVLLQQLSIFVWDQYKIDWNQSIDTPVSMTRKQRYLDYLSELLDTLSVNNALVQKIK